MTLHLEKERSAPNAFRRGRRTVTHSEKESAKARRTTLLQAYRQTGEPAIRDLLVAECTGLVSGLARGFANQGEQHDDLIQVGSIGLLKAIDRFDPDRGVEFTTYAVSAIVGEIRHHLRDKARLVRIPRGLWDLHVKLSRLREELTRSLGRPPTTWELGVAAGVSEREAAEALQVRSATQPASLSTPVGVEDGKEISLAELIGDDDPGYDATEIRLTLAKGLRRLAPRERWVLHMRYDRDLTQASIASELGVSQIHVSRIIRKALDTLGECVEAA